MDTETQQQLQAQLNNNNNQVNDKVEIELLKRENADLKFKLEMALRDARAKEKLATLVYKIKEAKEVLYTIESIAEMK